MVEKGKLELLNEDMWCEKYHMPCLDVPYEVLYYVGGLGFSNYECDLMCGNCSELGTW